MSQAKTPMRYADFYRQSIEQPDAFWTEQAKLIDWFKPFERVCNYDKPPFVHWFEGGLSNLCYNALDRHLKDRADQAALIAISTETGSEKSYRVAPGSPAHGGQLEGIGRAQGRPCVDLHAHGG